MARRYRRSARVARSQRARKHPLSSAARPIAAPTRASANVRAGPQAAWIGSCAAVDGFVASGMVRADAFQSTLGCLLVVQVLAFVWFLLPVKALAVQR